MSMGYFPIIFKDGMVILILKPGKDPTKVSSYRPITLLEVPGKILEKIINERVYGFAESHNKLHKNQFGFRRNRGTETAIIKMYEQIALNQRHQGQCNIVCRDIEKAFDKIWHRGLQYKIKQLEMPNILEKIACNFLEDRTARIKNKEYISNEIIIRSARKCTFPNTIHTVYIRHACSWPWNYRHLICRRCHTGDHISS